MSNMKRLLEEASEVDIDPKVAFDIEAGLLHVRFDNTMEDSGSRIEVTLDIGSNNGDMEVTVLLMMIKQFSDYAPPLIEAILSDKALLEGLINGQQEQS